MYSHNIQIDCSLQNFRELCRSFGVPGQDISFVVDNHKMRGCSKRIEIEKGLCAQNWEFQLHDDAVFNKADSEFYKEPFYCLHYFFSPKAGSVTINGEEFNVDELDKMNALISWDTSVELRFKKNDLIKCTTLIFTKKWLVEQLTACLGLEDVQLPEWLIKSQRIFFPNYTSLIDQMISSELFTQINMNHSVFQVKASLFHLLDNKLQSITGNTKTLYSHFVHDQIMVQIEKRIMGSLTKPLPYIQELAKEFFISPSTLKRHFKLFFGENIYEYYLRKKMNLARDMLTAGNLRVSEVAGELGYDSVSHFVHMFKKIHKISPGQIKKTRNNKAENNHTESSWGLS